MKLLLISLLLIVCLAAPTLAQDNCKALMIENLQLKQKMIEMQSQIMQVQYEQIIAELNKLQEAKNEKNTNSTDINTDSNK